MKQYNPNIYTKLAIFIVGFIAFFALIGIGGTAEYTEQILYTMRQETYDRVTKDMNPGCTDKEIVKKYLSNKKYYDGFK